ncbi:MAG: dihydrodipicolinate synthase family protein, partial [Pseudomonadota bacterium]
HGCITVVGNIAPKESAQLHEAWQNKDLDTFFNLRDRLAPLSRDLFCESNPAPVKYAASVLGLCSDEVRAPLVTASDQARAKVDAALKYAELTKAKAA